MERYDFAFDDLRPIISVFPSVISTGLEAYAMMEMCTLQV